MKISATISANKKLSGAAINEHAITGSVNAVQELSGNLSAVESITGEVAAGATLNGTAASQGSLAGNMAAAYGKPGIDGGYYIPSVDEAGELTWEASRKGMPEIAGANIKGSDGAPGADGQPGKDGYTPQRGTDYWTTSDIQAMVADAVNGVLAQKTTILQSVFPVGSQYITTENKNPSEVLGFGTWELVQKGFIEAQGNGTTTLFNCDTTNATSCTVYYRRSGNVLWLKFNLKNKVAIADTSITFGTLKLSALGVTALGYQTQHQKTFGSENGVPLMNLTSAGALSSVDVVIKNSGTSIAAETTLYGQYTLPMIASQMLDAFCDKFYWKRTA